MVACFHLFGNRSHFLYVLGNRLSNIPLIGFFNGSKNNQALINALFPFRYPFFRPLKRFGPGFKFNKVSVNG